MGKISATFRKRGQNFVWNFALSSAILVGGGAVILSLLYSQPAIALIVSIIAIFIAALAMQQTRKRLVIVAFDGDTLSILERHHKMTLTMPFVHKIGIRRKIATNNQPARAYLQLIVYTDENCLIFEERIPTTQDAPNLPALLVNMPFLCYRNLKPFPDVLWTIVQALGIPTNPDATSLSPLPTDDPQLHALYQTGKEDFLNYKVDSAVQIFSQIITLCPDQPIAYYNRGIVLLNQSIRLNDALQDFTKAITLNVSILPAYTHRAKTYGLLKQWEPALADAKFVLEMKPDAELFNLCGVAYHALNQRDNALESYTQAIHVDPSYARSYYNRALLFQRIGNTQNANEDFERAKILDPNIAIG